MVARLTGWKEIPSPPSSLIELSAQAVSTMVDTERYGSKQVFPLCEELTRHKADSTVSPPSAFVGRQA